MITPVTHTTLKQLSDPDFLAYATRYAEIEKQTIANIEQLGLPFLRKHELESDLQSKRNILKELGAVFANQGKSIHTHWISSACTACRTGQGSYTTFISLKCHRDCYFCFNPNQENYNYFQTHLRAAHEEISELAAIKADLSHVALTGGEPLIHKEESIKFFSAVHEKMPHVHTRLYTAGDPLSESTARALKKAGLQEIRFSIKIDDPADKQNKVLERIRIARQYIPTVMVEMPVLPGSLEEMQMLLLELDAIGIDGINLLEFCFPLNNAQAYQQRGFKLKYPPYQTYYNYWYAGGLAIAQSESVCLQLLIFALKNKLKLGVHYCSLENKHTGQVFQQNSQHVCDEFTYFSEQDYFLKTAKVFGPENIKVTQHTLKAHRHPYTFNQKYKFIQFHPESIPLLKGFVKEVCIASSIAEHISEHEMLIKEVQLAKTNPEIFQIHQI